MLQCSLILFFNFIQVYLRFCNANIQIVNLDESFFFLLHIWLVDENINYSQNDINCTSKKRISHSISVGSYILFRYIYHHNMLYHYNRGKLTPEFRTDFSFTMQFDYYQKLREVYKGYCSSLIHIVDRANLMTVITAICFLYLTLREHDECYSSISIPLSDWANLIKVIPAVWSLYLALIEFDECYSSSSMAVSDIDWFWWMLFQQFDPYICLHEPDEGYSSSLIPVFDIDRTWWRLLIFEFM